MTMALQSLPIELLHHVAWYCSPRDVLALVGSCRSLRNACDDSSVFKRVFIDNIPRVSSRSIANKDTLVALISKKLENVGDTLRQYQADQQRLIWKCLSMAGPRLEGISDELSKPVSNVSSDLAAHSQTITPAFQKVLLMFTMPGLPDMREPVSFPDTGETSKTIEALQKNLGLLSMSIVWGCSSICDNEVMRLLDELCTYIYALTPNVPEPPYLVRSLSSRDLEISFCLAVCAMGDIGWLYYGMNTVNTRYPIDNTPPDFDINWPQRCFAFIPRALRRLLHTFAGNWGVRDSTAPDSLPQSMALLMCALVARAQLAMVPSPDSAPPRPENIPFHPQEHIHSSSDTSAHEPSGAYPARSIPLPEAYMAAKGENRLSVSPFVNGCWGLWYKSRTRAMMDDIDSGEWQGLYTYGLETQSRVDPPMQQIRFQKSSPQGEGSRVDICAVDCADSVGAFRLDGHLDLTTCNLSLRKRYLGRHYFDWRCAVTPLGITGYYFSGDRERDPEGVLWLWKRNWKSES
ncbi:hypothetical protein PG984_015002 [Apiospora sp. TS-2023a]